MKWTIWFVTYNGMGGHPVLSFSPDILLAADGNSFGSAVAEIEIYAHVEPAHGPPPESDFLRARFDDRLSTLPKAWFRRKKKRVDIAYHSHVAYAEDLLGGDFAAKKVPNTALLRRACHEVAGSMTLLKTCLKKSDDFDVGSFLNYVDAKIVELDTLDNSELLRRLAKAQAAERDRVARASDRETPIPKAPLWKPPKDIAKTLEDEGVWEDEGWAPMLLSAMSWTEYEGRQIPVAWQIEFDPSDEALEAANAKLKAIGVDPDGYGWGEFIQKSIQKVNREMAKRLHTSDCEKSTCVIWVESEDDCRTLLETTWKLFFDE